MTNFEANSENARHRLVIFSRQRRQQDYADRIREERGVKKSKTIRKPTSRQTILTQTETQTDRRRRDEWSKYRPTREER